MRARPSPFSGDVGRRCDTVDMDLLALVIGLIVGALVGGLAVAVLSSRRTPTAPVAEDPALVEARHQAQVAEVRAGEEAAKSLLREELAVLEVALRLELGDLRLHLGERLLDGGEGLEHTALGLLARLARLLLGAVLLAEAVSYTHLTLPTILLV